MVIDSFAGRLL